MVECPRCSAKLDVEFGMITCPKCSSVVFVEFDGSVKVADEAVSESTAATRSRAAEQIQAQENDLPDPDMSAFDDAIADSLFAPRTLEAQELVNPGDISQTREPSSGLFHFESSESSAETYQEPHQVDLDTPMETVSSEIVSPNDPLGVTAYANSEFSQGKDGPFLFNLFISGLDSKEIRESLREAMNDSRFSFDANQLLGQIRDGKLVMKNISPVQASILVNRLKRLPLGISWEQHAITTVEKF